MDKIQMLSCNFQVLQLLVWEFYGEVSKRNEETAWQEGRVAGMAPEVESYLAAHGFLASFLQGSRDHAGRAWASAQNC